ncbi:MAG: hypothetical protein KF760_11245 [Candidatus Eremiobacteraeota bacterium]|nr:hypothetical protein [Candidatus Eremiobacteraeota bacterium]MCW5870623.1 hypothetical protein [Candidatus Eremiobacteraeota bacterium]
MEIHSNRYPVTQPNWTGPQNIRGFRPSAGAPPLAPCAQRLATAGLHDLALQLLQGEGLRLPAADGV